MIPELSDLRLSRLQQARTLADRINDPAAKFWAAYQLALALFERADPDGVDQALGHAEEMARMLGQALMQFFVTAARCSQAMLNGQLDAAGWPARRCRSSRPTGNQTPPSSTADSCSTSNGIGAACRRCLPLSTGSPRNCPSFWPHQHHSPLPRQ
jgi:hypothetical protein